MEINFVLGKNGGYMPSTLGGRSFIVVRQADENLAVSKNLKFGSFNLKARLGCLNGFMVLLCSFAQIDIYGQYLKEMLL